VVSFIPAKEPPISNGYDVGWPPDSVRTLRWREKSPSFAGNRISINRFSSKYLGRYTGIACPATVRESNVLWTSGVLFWVSIFDCKDKDKVVLVLN
jgi:hypothetical protein